MFTVGDRVAVDNGSKIGTLKFLGATQFRQGVWAGVELDEPLGKHDGTVEGVKYFQCAPKHGLFVHPSKLLRSDSKGHFDTYNDGGNHTSLKKHTQAFETKSPTLATPSRKRIMLGGEERSLPVQTPLTPNRHENIRQIPPTSTFTLQPTQTKKSTELDKYDLPAMETELKRRQADVASAKQGLEGLRLQISDPQNVSEYIANRERLLFFVDGFEKALAKWERQLKRVSYLHVRSEREKQPEINDVNSKHLDSEALLQRVRRLEQDKEALLQERVELIGRVEESNKRAFEAEDSARTLEDSLERAREAQSNLQTQIRQQASVAASLNVERSLLRKEVAETRVRLSSLLEDSFDSNKHEDVMGDQNAQGEMDSPTDLRAELRRTRDRHEQVLQQTAEELERLNGETNEAIAKYQQQLREKELEIARLKREGPFTDANQVETLKKERNDAQEQLKALQGKLLGYQDAAQMEAKYRAQTEALRQSLEENWKRFTTDVAERDARIEELQSQLTILSRPPVNDSTTNAPISSGLLAELPAGIKADVEKLAQQLSDLQRQYVELYRAKQSQEKYLVHQISKLKRRVSAQLKTVIEQEQEGAEKIDDVPDPRINEMEEKLKNINIEYEKLKHEKETELYGLQLRLNRAQEDRDKAREQAEQSRSPTMEVEILRKEISCLQQEKDTLHRALREDSNKVRELSLTAEQAQERIIALEDLLNNRSDELARLESRYREQGKTLQAQEQTIEHLKREYASRSRVFDTERDVLQKKMDDLEHTLRLRRSEPVERLTREKGDLLDALETLRHDYEKLKLQTSLEPIGSRLGTSSPDSSRIRDLESRLATVQAEVDVKSRQIKELTEESEAVEGRMRILRNEGATAFTIRELDDLKEQLRILRNEKNNLAGALSDSEAEKEKLRGALTDAQSELSHLTEISEELEIIRSNLADETRRREEADRLNKHHVDMIELAEKEMSTLQERIAHFEELDQQRRTILVKYQAVKEEIQLMDERISVKDEEIKELQKRLQTGGNSAPSIVISKASRSTEDVSVKQLIEERDAALADRAHLQRMNMSIEHEKKLLEKELATIKEALDDFKTETGLRQQQELLTKAGTIINELGRAADWSLMTPIKSIAAFMRIYKPAEVDVEALQAEYDSLLASFAHPERQQPRYTTEGSGPFCGICHRSGHVATQCENMSDGDDVGLGFSLSTENIAGDPRAFSA